MEDLNISLLRLFTSLYFGSNVERATQALLFYLLLHDWSTSMLLFFVEQTLVVDIVSCEGRKHHVF